MAVEPDWNAERRDDRARGAAGYLADGYRRETLAIFAGNRSSVCA
jgi:hypothetical protein